MAAHNCSDGRWRRPEVRALAETLLPPGEWRWEAGDNGRPRLLTAEGMPGPDVSLSHSGSALAAAVTECGRVGVDVEEGGRRKRDWLSLAKAYFSPEEHGAVEAEGEDAFLAFWTLREAVAKLGDGGLAVALALDGAALLRGRSGVCSLDGAVAGHRRLGAGLHLSLAWRPSADTPAVSTPAVNTPDAEETLSAILDAFVADCGCSSFSI